MIADKISKNAIAFLRDEEQGSATLWNLFWLCGFGALLGLGLDTTSAMNMKGRLQMVADTAAHAAAIDLFPVAAGAVDTAVVYAAENIDQIDVVNTDDVTLGHWDLETRTFATENVPNYNAVRVIATRDTARDNALGTFFLRLVGFYDWDIRTASTALYYTDLSLLDRCFKEGLFAGEELSVTANNTIIGDYCLHGEGGFAITENNYITCGVEISLPDSSLWNSQSVQTPTGLNVECNDDYGNLSSDEMVSQVVRYRSIRSLAQAEYDNVKKFLDAFVAGEPINDPFNAIPPYITTVQQLFVENFNALMKAGTLSPGTLYRVECEGTKKGVLMTGIIQNIGVYTDCPINVGIKKIGATNQVNNSLPMNYTCEQAVAGGYTPYQTMLDTAPGRTYRDGVTTDTYTETCAIEPNASGLWDNVFLFTTSADKFTLPNSLQVGRFDSCKEGGGVRLYAAGSYSSPAGLLLHGSQFVTLDDADIAASGTTFGMTIQAKGYLSYAAQGAFSGCPADEDLLASDVVLTVRPVAIVQ